MITSWTRRRGHWQGQVELVEGVRELRGVSYLGACRRACHVLLILRLRGAERVPACAGVKRGHGQAAAAEVEGGPELLWETANAHAGAMSWNGITPK